jgi:8-oxo-dGTP diphosphatase
VTGPAVADLFTHYAISDRQAGDAGGLLARSAPGRVAVQLRDKDLPEVERRRLAAALRTLTAAHGAALIVGGGDVALARAVGADGVHLPSSVPPRTHDGLLVGASCHDSAELERACAAGVDFVTLSPVLASPGKGDPLGWSRFAELARACATPIFALGGLGPDDLDLARSHGAWGVAGIRGFLD